MSTTPFIVMDAFCLRSFLSKSDGGSGIYIDQSPSDFTNKVNEFYHSIKRSKNSNEPFNQSIAQSTNDSDYLSEGYAPFCKHIFMPNHLPDLKCSYLPITEINQSMIKTEYQRRTEKELPVLARFFPRQSINESDLPSAPYLDIILYSRAQVEIENAAMANQSINQDSQSVKLPAIESHLSSQSTDPNWQWAIVSIKPQSVDIEVPMLPITMMRNALGVDEGGSGVKLDRGKYEESVKFWSKHASIQ